MVTLPVTYGYARVSKADDDSKNPDTQLRILADHGIRDQLVYTDVASGRSLQRPDWQALMVVLQLEDTVVVAFLDRFSRNFEEGYGPRRTCPAGTSALWPSGRTLTPGRGARRRNSSRGPCWPKGPTRWTPRVSGSNWGWNVRGLRGSGWVVRRH